MLDENEFGVFVQYMSENQKARHGDGIKTPDNGKQAFDIYNTFTPGANGVSKQDVQLGMICLHLHIAA